jgi:hypothetical protein
MDADTAVRTLATLDPDAIRVRLAAIAAEEKSLRVLLRAALARQHEERKQREARS